MNDVRALLAAAREGDADSFAVLYEMHRPAALRLARRCRATDPEDVVAHVFAEIWSLIVRGAGPADNFQSYLFTGVRNASVRSIEQARRVRPTDEDATLDSVREWTVAELEPDLSDRLLAALRALPEDRWREILWKTTALGMSPSEVADDFGINPVAAAALAYRARVGLRAAFEALP